MVTLSIWTVLIGIAVILCLAVLDWVVSTPEMSGPVNPAVVTNAPLPQAHKRPEPQSQRFPPRVAGSKGFGNAA